jgi:hypothetical protein
LIASAFFASAAGGTSPAAPKAAAPNQRTDAKTNVFDMVELLRRTRSGQIIVEDKCAAGTTELGSCLTDATRGGRSRRAILKLAAPPGPNVWR